MNITDLKTRALIALENFEKAKGDHLRVFGTTANLTDLDSMGSEIDEMAKQIHLLAEKIRVKERLIQSNTEIEKLLIEAKKMGINLPG